MKHLIKSKKYKKRISKKTKGGNNEVVNNNILFPLIGYKPVSSPIILNIDEKIQ